MNSVIDRSLINHDDVKVDLVKYTNIFRQFGQITFELSSVENKELILSVQQFKEIENENAGFDMGKWVSENINPLPSGKAFAVFSFLVTQWNPHTIITNGESPKEGRIYVCVMNESSVQ